MAHSPENSPEKKIKPVFDDCNHCGERYQITAMNGRLVLFNKQPEINYMVCTCTECRGVTKLFIDDYTMNQAVGNGLPVHVEDYADDTSYAQWLDIKGITLVQPSELTDRQEKLVANLGAILRSVPSDLFWDTMSSPNDQQPYPQRWR